MTDGAKKRQGTKTAGGAGVYLLVLELPRPITLRVGALGRFGFQRGWYVYAGSARRGLRARVERHLAPAKPLRWHVDYLTTAHGVQRVGALLVAEGTASECSLNRAAGALLGGAVPAPGFGASDCRAGCPAHLWFSPGPLSPAGLAEALGLAARSSAIPGRVDPRSH